MAASPQHNPSRRSIPHNAACAGIILATAACTFAAVNRLRYRRSAAATACEAATWARNVKSCFADPAVYQRIMEAHAVENETPYRIPPSVRFTVPVEEYSFQGMQVVRLGAPTGRSVLYIHGGGYINHPAQEHWRFLNNLAAAAHVQITVPVYPLAPVHSHQEAHALILQLYRTMVQQEGAGRVAIMGDSAGGGLACTLCECLPEGIDQPACLVLMSPWLDVSMENPDIPAYDQVDPMLSAYGLVDIGKRWANGVDVHDPLVSPLYGTVGKLRNVVLFAGTREVFYPDVVEFACKLEEAGVNVRLHIGTGLNHVYPLLPVPEARSALNAIVAALNDGFASGCAGLHEPAAPTAF